MVDPGTRGTNNAPAIVLQAKLVSLKHLVSLPNAPSTIRVCGQKTLTCTSELRALETKLRPPAKRIVFSTEIIVAPTR